MNLTPGTRLGPYKILAPLGAGGMGEVYRAHDTRLGRDVAIKVLAPHLAAAPEMRARFEREARTISQLNHPHICALYDIGRDGETAYLVMELVEGETLAQRLERGPLPVAEVLSLGVQIADALGVAHRRGIVHRDLKPGNVMLTRSGAKLMDFGLARAAGLALAPGDLTESPTVSRPLTAEGTIVGTFQYMAPEQLRGQELDCRTDLFSLGVVLYELVTSQLPFRGEHEAAVMYSITNEEPVPVSRLRADAPAGLDALIGKCLRKDRTTRYQSAEAVVADLRRLQDASPGGLPVVQERRRLRRFLLAGIVPLAVLGAYLLAPLVRPRAPNSKMVAVLPFLNLSENRQDEYFSDGMTDDILTLLYKIGDLKVVSRTTMRQYKDTKKSIPEIGKELHADAVLEGSVRRSGDHLHVVVQLIDARSDDHLWAETYDRQMTDVLEIQTEIARKIAAALQARLSGAERNRLVAPGATNVEAQNLIWEGAYYAARGSREDVAQAIGKYQEALALDPNNARGWAQLATAYARQADLGGSTTEEGYRRARQAANRSLSLDPELAEGHTIMGWIRRSYDWDWVGAEAECRKALELAPGDVAVIRNMANMEKSLGRFDRAIALAKQAVDLDPMRVPLYTSLGLVSMYGGRLDEAAEAYRKAIALDAQYPIAHTFLGLIYLLQGRRDEAIAEIQDEHDEGWRLYGLAQAYYAAGRRNDADTALKALIERYGSESAFQVAEAYAYRGEVDSAFVWLEKAYASRDGGLSELKGDPFLRRIETDPRYAEFVRKMKLPL